MKYSIDRLNQLKNELTQITKDVRKGDLSHAEAADKIIQVREEMEKVIEHLKRVNRNSRK